MSQLIGADHRELEVCHDTTLIGPSGRVANAHAVATLEAEIPAADHFFVQAMHPRLGTSMAAIVAFVSKLRPGKVRVALRRRWFEWRMAKLRLVPFDGLVALGSDYGGYVVPPDLVKDGCVCYCVGTGADISFELALLERRRVEIRSFEAVLNLVEHVREQARGRAGVTIEHAALALADGPLRMQVSHVPVSQSVSAAGLYEGARYVEVPGRRLDSLMSEHGDDHIDLLKLDVEGFEYELLPSLDLSALGVKVLCVQLHHTATVRDAKALVRQLHGDGFELVACHPTVKLTFVHTPLVRASAGRN